MRTGGTPILGKAPYLYHYIYVYIYNIHIYIYTRDDMNLNGHTYMSNVQNVADIPIKGGHQSITRDKDTPITLW